MNGEDVFTHIRRVVCVKAVFSQQVGITVGINRRLDGMFNHDGFIQRLIFREKVIHNRLIFNGRNLCFRVFCRNIRNLDFFVRQCFLRQFLKRLIIRYGLVAGGFLGFRFRIDVISWKISSAVISGRIIFGKGGIFVILHGNLRFSCHLILNGWKLCFFIRHKRLVGDFFNRLLVLNNNFFALLDHRVRRSGNRFSDGRSREASHQHGKGQQKRQCLDQSCFSHGFLLVVS